MKNTRTLRKATIAITAIAFLGFGMAGCASGGSAKGSRNPQLAGNIVISSYMVALSREVTATYTGTEQGVSMRWNKNGEPFGTAETGTTLKATFQEAGIYTVTVSADGFQSKTGDGIMALDTSGSAETEGGFSYRKLGNVVVVMETVGRVPAELTIPGTLGGLPVVGIWNDAFKNERLTSVTIPDGVIHIGNHAFFSTRLTSVTIPSSVSSIGLQTFAYNNLTSVTISDGVTSIGSSAFGNNKLTSIDIPDSVTTISVSAFGYNNDFASINVSSGNQNFSSRDGVLYDKAGTVLLAWPKAKSPVSITDGVTGIGESAFSSNGITEVTIPSSVTSIGNGAFGYNKLTTVTIPDGVTSIGERAFSSNALTTVTIPSSVTTIGERAFSGNKLTSITIPESVIGIGNGAFAGNSLTSVDIPASVISIGGGAFAGEDLASIKVSSDSQNFSSRDGVLYNKAGTVLLAWPGGKTPVSIPGNVTSIEDNAFSGNRSLTAVTIPGNVNSIGKEAFSSCGLISVTIGNGVTSIGDYAFADNFTITSVTISNSVTSIGAFAFHRNRLTTVTIPGSVANIGEHAFYENSLTSVTIGNGVTSIGDGTFADQNLTTVTIPGSVTNIGNYSFSSNNITSITIGANVNIGDNRSMGNYGGTFLTLYNGNGKLAGTYAYAGGNWTRQP